jgi:RHS repeat-associated protein
VANADGSLKAEYSYDAWGRLRNPATQTAYTPGSEPVLFLSRGYTGHEYLPWFGLVNMNARLYDPALGRFLSPDPYVQNPLFSQNYNRYTYAMNNPLVYIDQDGESLLLLIGGAILGAYLGGLASNKGELNPLKWNWKDATTYLGLGFGMILGYYATYGFLNPGTLGYTFGVNNAWGAASVTLSGAGFGSDWSFQWTTSAGGGGKMSNVDYSYSTIKQNVDKSTNDAKQEWDLSAYAYASSSLIFLSNDFTGVGVIDDVIIPGAYTAATFKFAYDNQYLIEKQAREIAYWTQKNLSLKQGFVYELQATRSGYYPDVHGGTRYLEKGDVWKYGETTNGGSRYPNSYYKTMGLQMRPIFYGNQIEIKIQEKIMIYGYYFEHRQLPAGNKIFR